MLKTLFCRKDRIALRQLLRTTVCITQQMIAAGLTDFVRNELTADGGDRRALESGIISFEFSLVLQHNDLSHLV